jgi:acyl carrier protein
VELQARLKQFILDVIVTESGRDIEDLAADESLLDSGVLDSLGILKLVSFLDEELNIDLPLERLRMEDFASLDSICALVERHRNA